MSSVVFSSDSSAPSMPADWRDLLSLTKPRVMSLVIVTAICGMVAAPTAVHPVLAFAAILALALGAGAAGALNQWYESDLDAKMARTATRPIPAGRLDRDTALHFGVGSAMFALLLMQLAANIYATLALALSIAYYVGVYTIWLKPRTPQNIVIGGAAGAFPPLIGWLIAGGGIDWLPILLFALIFLWTPPHSWALALFCRNDYSAAGIPMMSVVAGETSTRRQILLYSIAMSAVAVAPWAMGLAGAVYGVPAVLLSIVFLGMAARVAWRKRAVDTAMQAEKQLFAFSIAYLFIIFVAIAVDRGFA